MDAILSALIPGNMAEAAQVAQVVFAVALLDVRKRVSRIERHLWPEVFGRR